MVGRHQTDNGNSQLCGPAFSEGILQEYEVLSTYISSSFIPRLRHREVRERRDEGDGEGDWKFRYLHTTPTP